MVSSTAPKHQRHSLRHLPLRSVLEWALVSVLFSCLLLPMQLLAQGHDEHRTHSVDHHERDALHFSHPLIGEAPAPGTEVRLAFSYLRAPVESSFLASNLEASYAISRSVGIGVAVPLMAASGEVEGAGEAHMEIGVTAAVRPFSRRSFLLSYGVELGVPLSGQPDRFDGQSAHGEEHGDEAVRIEPFVGAGQILGDLETLGTLTLGIPAHGDASGHAGLDFAYCLSFIYHLAPRFEGLLEFDGPVAGDAPSHNITPGIKVAPVGDAGLRIALGISLPLSSRQEYETLTHMAIFYHF